MTPVAALSVDIIALGINDSKANHPSSQTVLIGPAQAVSLDRGGPPANLRQVKTHLHPQRSVGDTAERLF
jgi:hypothetical protein